MNGCWNSCCEARGPYTEGAPTINDKAQGGLPLCCMGLGIISNVGSSPCATPRGVYLQVGPSCSTHDVSSDTKVLIFNWQYNAPNRIQVNTAANCGLTVRIGSGNGDMCNCCRPTDYKHFQIGGNDTVGGQARENPKMIVIDLNATSQEACVGCFDNTDVQTFGFGFSRFDLSGASTVYTFYQRAFLMETTKNACCIPRFTGACSVWCDIITAMGTVYNTKITDEWLKREGNVFSLATPIEFGCGCCAFCFCDMGATVIWANDDNPADPRVRLTNQAFRVYANLRCMCDSLTLSGLYDAGDSRPAWCFDLDFGTSSPITVTGATFKRTGGFTVGSSIIGAATFDCNDIVTINHICANLDGSTFKNPNGCHLLRILT